WVWCILNSLTHKKKLRDSLESTKTSLFNMHYERFPRSDFDASPQKYFYKRVKTPYYPHNNQDITIVYIPFNKD
ncbi:MAG: hypothetical protein MJE63_14680, partial [Proteobacteria bacterium]|nr:hypothetical protein [Pseudomonadota bacterium]